jgi:hypothetical protein
MATQTAAGAANVVELQAQLDRFADYYNHERPHQGIGRVTPASRWHASDPAAPSASPLEHPDYAPHKPTRHNLNVAADGTIGIGRYIIHIGVAHAGRPTVVMADERWVNVYIDGLLISERHRLKLQHRRIHPLENAEAESTINAQADRYRCPATSTATDVPRSNIPVSGTDDTQNRRRHPRSGGWGAGVVLRSARTTSEEGSLMKKLLLLLVLLGAVAAAVTALRSDNA